MNKTIVTRTRRAARGDRQRLGAGEMDLRAELVPGRRPRRLLGRAREGLLQGQGPRRDAGEFQGLGRHHRQGRYRPRRCGPRRRRGADRLEGARHDREDHRHGVRQDAAQHLQPQEQAARQAQGPRGRDARLAPGRCAAPDVPGLRQSQRHRCQQGQLGEHRAGRQDRRRRREAHGRRQRLHDRPAALREGRRQGQDPDDAVGRLRLRPLLDVDHGQREDHEGEAQAAEGLPRGLLHGLARRHGRSEGGNGDLQEARARDRRRCADRRT